MSLMARVRHHLSYVSFRIYMSSPVTGSNPVHSMGSNRPFAQPTRMMDEVVEIDQTRLPADYDPATFDPTEHRSPPTDKVWNLVDEISRLTLVETAELSSIMMKKLGKNEPPLVGVMKPGAAGVAMKAEVAAAKEETKPEKTGV